MCGLVGADPVLLIAERARDQIEAHRRLDDLGVVDVHESRGVSDFYQASSHESQGYPWPVGKTGQSRSTIPLRVNFVANALLAQW